MLIGADTNCSSKSSSRRRKAWSDFCENFSLTSHAGPDPTFHHHNGSSESCIDTILSSKNLKPSTIVQLCTLEDPINLSSHDVLTTTLTIPAPKNPRSKYEQTYTKFNRRKVVWKEEYIADYQALSSKALSDALDFWDSPEYIPLLCSLFSNLLVKAAELVFEVKESKVKTEKAVSRKHRAAQQNPKKMHRNLRKLANPLRKAIQPGKNMPWQELISRGWQGLKRIRKSKISTMFS